MPQMWYLGRPLGRQTTDMTSPVQCSYCGGIYDLGKVEVTARYADCSMWKAPCCKRTVDDRQWKSLKDYTRLEKP